MREYYSNSKSQIPHMVFVGRYAPLHAGHTWIVERKIAENPDKPVLILVRDTSFDEFDAETRAELVKRWMEVKKIVGSVAIICDVEGVYYGRGVGYNIEELEPPEDIKAISATEIRKRMKAGDASWKDMVADGTADYIEEIMGEDVRTK